MSTNYTTCHLCKESTGKVSLQETGDKKTYACPRCGVYIISGTLDTLLQMGNYTDLLPKVCIATRRAAEANNPLTIRTEAELKAAADSVYIPSLIQDRLNLILRIIYEESHPLGHAIPVRPMYDYPKFYCLDMPEFSFFVKHLLSEMSLWQESDALRLEVRGLDRVEKALGGVGTGRKAFVAMSFDAEDINLFDDVFFPICDEAGYVAERVDRGHHLNRIDDAIEAGIRTSAFVIADFTKNKSGVYYEAGFAKALGRPLILTCPKSMLADHSLHFDVNHYPFLDYETPEELKGKLRDRILGSIGPYEPK